RSAGAAPARASCAQRLAVSRSVASWPEGAQIDWMPPASVAQWKSSCVLSKRLGVRVPAGSQSLFASDQVFLLRSDHSECIFGRFLAAFENAVSRNRGGFDALHGASFDALERRNRPSLAS